MKHPTQWDSSLYLRKLCKYSILFEKNIDLLSLIKNWLKVQLDKKRNSFCANM